MDCKTVSTLLTERLGSGMTALQEQAVREHCAACPACAHLLAVLSDCRALDGDAPVPGDFSRGWRQAIRKEATAMQKQNRTPRRAWRALASIAAALVFLTGGTLMARNAGVLAPQTQSGAAAPAAAKTRSALTAGDASATNVLFQEAAESEDGASYDAPAGLSAAAGGADAPADSSLKIIRTAEYTLATQSFDDDLAALKALAAGSQGWIAAISVYGEAREGSRSAALTLRIPAASLDGFCDGVQAVGRVTYQSESAQDVSESYADTSARLQTQIDKMARLQALLKESGELSDLLAIETEIADTQYLIDRYTGALQGLDSRVNYATVNVSLNEETPADAAMEQTLTLGERLSLAAGSSLAAAGQFAQDMLVFLVMAVPYLAALAALILLALALARRKNK